MSLGQGVVDADWAIGGGDEEEDVSGVADDSVGASYETQLDPEIYDGMSPVNSLDLERDSPMNGGYDDDDDLGPPSVETQTSDHRENVEVSDITSTWISTGGQYSATNQTWGSGGDFLSPNDSANSSGCTNQPDGETGLMYGPHLPAAFIGPMPEPGAFSCGDVTDNAAIAGICGLRNLGNTCFMAAGIQCLVNTPPIAQYFFENRHDSGASLPSLVSQFSQLTHKMWSGRFSSLRPTDFKQAFGDHWKDFRDYRQHDCQEFVTLLLEALRKQMGVHEQAEENVDNVKCLTEKESSSVCNSTCCDPHSPRDGTDDCIDPIEDLPGGDSGGASPKSSISGSSADGHLVNLRLRPIPEEMRSSTSLLPDVYDDISLTGTTSGYDAESVTSDISDYTEILATSGAPSIRRYNQLGCSDDNGSCDNSNCDTTGQLAGRTPLCDSQYQVNMLGDSGSSLLREREEGALIRKNVNQPEGEDLQPVKKVSNSPALNFMKLEDILKETKTSNVNVLVKETPANNNQLLFDSVKYGRNERVKLKNTLDNLAKSGCKRVKEVNILMDRKELNTREISSTICSNIDDAAFTNEGVFTKRIRLDEKNVTQSAVQFCQQEQCVGGDLSCTGITTTSSEYRPPADRSYPALMSTIEERMADDCFKAFVGDTESVVVDSFYGQFRSTLVCAACDHTSVTFDPFGTLSVPLPFANQIQISVTYISHDGGVPVRYLVTLCKVSRVCEVKEAIARLVGVGSNENIVMAEVFDNHIARILDDNCQTKFLNCVTRSIYVFHLAPSPLSIDEEIPQCDGSSTAAGEASGSGRNAASACAGGSGGSLWRSCTICLEEMCQTDLGTHAGCDDCLLCDGCIQMSCKHHGDGMLKCPVCQSELHPSDFVAVDTKKETKPKTRVLRVPLVFRWDQDSGDNNKRSMALVGHPVLLALPSRLSPGSLLNAVAQRIPVNAPYTLLLVEGKGYNCSRCLFSSHCHGCEAANGNQVQLQTGDSLCVRFTNLTEAQHSTLAAVIDHPSLGELRQNAPLTLYDCLRAFTRSETLEEADSWLCPNCDRKQQATKTISVWRYPPYLIIHLERFLFHGMMSTKLDDKVIFPLVGLDISDYVAADSGNSLIYNLYAIVCHLGVAQAGHYTAFARSPVNNEWHYFNDDSVTRQTPREEEYSTAYLLFYQRQGMSMDFCLPRQFSFVDSMMTQEKKKNGLEEEVEGNLGMALDEDMKDDAV